MEIQKSPGPWSGPFFCPYVSFFRQLRVGSFVENLTYFLVHKLTKQLKKGLTAVASKLPETTETFREKVTGETMLAEGKTHLTTGKAIKKGYLYGREAQRPVNHARRLCAACEQAGRAGVLAYCTPYIESENLALFSANLSELVPA